ncbi:hypothetical protein FACS1894167_12730 [Synergistales bacterium]|nr:hypothetical protein FACS1894167_12730 [Synergistales bacterium]
MRFTAQEEAAMASAVGVDIDDFRLLYVHNKYWRPSLREKSNYDCIFLERPIRCRVYGARPSQCRTFPFWRDILSGRYTWDSYAKSCPGMNSGKYYSADEIREILVEG